MGGGEVDLVASFGEERVAVEVKSGLATSIGDPEYHFDEEKQRRLWKLAGAVNAYRVDFVGIEVSERGVRVRWLPAVF
jgi:Holliday junction resolvase-like predicted endonuclease